MQKFSKKRNIDESELAKFKALASKWWDKSGEMKALHDVNPLRIEFITKFTTIKNKKILDIGCGGGILTESLAEANGIVTGIDASEEILQIAKLHAIETNKQVDYILSTAEELALKQENKWDIVTCMEMLEHVPHPEEIIAATAKLLKPGGMAFFSTFNRNPKSFLGAIVGAEYILNLLPKGTHKYANFIKPSELQQWSETVNLDIKAISGIEFNVMTRKYYLGSNVDMNYISFHQK